MRWHLVLIFSNYNSDDFVLSRTVVPLFAEALNYCFEHELDIGVILLIMLS